MYPSARIFDLQLEYDRTLEQFMPANALPHLALKIQT